MNAEIRSTIVELVGLGLIVVAVSMVAVPLGVAAAGLCLLIIGFNIGDSK